MATMTDSVRQILFPILWRLSLDTCIVNQENVSNSLWNN